MDWSYLPIVLGFYMAVIAAVAFGLGALVMWGLS